jgi:dipeptidyl aminopeptidase/acylaminoacyl peptidase
MQKILVPVFFLLIFKQSTAQDGKIIDQMQVVMNDSLLGSIARYRPEVKEINDSVVIYKITYLSDGLKVKGYMVFPKKPGKYPCVIYNRGGNREFGKLNEWDYGYIMAQIASWGYIVVGSQYRGNDGGEGQEEFGGKDIDDVMNLFPLLNHIQKADTSRIGMFGISRGGMMTYISLKKTKQLKAAVVISGVTDLIKMLDTRPEFDAEVYGELIPDYKNNKTKLLRERSAVYFADEICKTTPIFILQGTSDWRVPTNQVIDLVNKFYEVKQPFRFSLFEGGSHGVLEFWNELSRQTKVFLDRYLRDKKLWPSLEFHGD